VLFALGDGAFMTGSAVFFTQVVGLSAAQVGLGITLGGVASFLVAVPAGLLADRIGPQRMWWMGAAVRVCFFLMWPFITGLWAFLAMCVAVEVTGSAAGAGRGAYVLNVGFTVGAAIGGLALAFDSDQVVRFVPWGTALLIGVNAFLISRLPPEPARVAPLEELPRASGALRNHGFLGAAFCTGVLNTNQVLLNIVIPLWLVEATDAPRELLAWRFGTNTVLSIFLPPRVARGVRDLRTALKAAGISTTFFVVSCLITLVTHDTVGWTTIALVWLGHVTVTGAELALSAATWSFESELSDPHRRGEYQGAHELGSNLGFVWAPALYTWLAMTWGAAGWLLIAGIVLCAYAGLRPSTRAAQRFLERHQLDPSL
jgi:MFS family permease